MNSFPLRTEVPSKWNWFRPQSSVSKINVVNFEEQLLIETISDEKRVRWYQYKMRSFLDKFFESSFH